MVEEVKMNKPVEAGDLVEFHSSFESFMRDYENRNPGIVLSVKKYLSFSSLWIGLALIEHDLISMSLTKYSRMEGFLRWVFMGMS